MLCSICKENVAVIYITKIVNSKQVQEGLCIPCAKKQGIGPFGELLNQINFNQEDIDNLNKQMGEILENLEIIDSKEKETHPNNTNGIFDFLGKMFSKEDDEPDTSFEKDKNVKTKNPEKKNVKRRKFLDLYGINLTDYARENKIDSVIGREKEIERVIQILNKRTKNNPALIGEPGVGKTAIAEGLALRIVNHQVPPKLFNYEIYLLDLTALVAGTQFRGQFEGRIKSVIDEVKSLGNIILVIDEMHNIMSTGEADGAMNAGNILKPALARGEIQVIGTTTLKEYRKYIEKDAALERRFQPVIIEEPSCLETIEMLKGIKKHYEEYHKIIIPDETLEAAVLLSERYIHDRFLPDKAIDVLDEACSRANLLNVKLAKLELLKHNLKKVQQNKEEAVSTDSIENYQKAADLKIEECKLIEEIGGLEEENKGYVLSLDHIALVIQSWTKIPIHKINQEESDKLLNLEKQLNAKVIGQSHAISTLSNAIIRNRTGLKNKKRPASFIFVGPTGVGKTELARTLCCELFGSEQAMIRVDMSEYMEKHSVSKLIGSPPGYVGFDEAGQLTEKVRRNPYSVILLDEIEKAHPDIFNILLQVLEDGRLTDSQGRVVNFQNTVIIMTSNAGSNLNNNAVGFSLNNTIQMENKIRSILNETFRPEFLNRVDDIIVFNTLKTEDLLKIIDLMLNEVRDELNEHRLALDVSSEAKQFILDKSYESKYGARPLRRAIQKMIEDKISEMLLRKEIKEGDRIRVELNEGNLEFKI